MINSVEWRLKMPGIFNQAAALSNIMPAVTAGVKLGKVVLNQ